MVFHQRRIAWTAKLGRVVIGADAHPAQVVGDVVDAIGHCAGKLGIDEVVDIDQLWLALGAPLPTVVLEIAHQFLLFRINRDDRLVRGQEPLGLVVDIVELRVTIDVSTAFFDFAVGLKTVAQSVQKLAHHRGRDLVSFLSQRAYELTQAQRRPQQRLHGIAARGRLNQRLQIAE